MTSYVDPSGAKFGSSPDPGDSVTRTISLEKVDANRHRRWAISLEAFRLSRGVERPIESPADIQIAGTIIPVIGRGTGHIRNMRVRYLGGGQ